MSSDPHELDPQALLPPLDDDDGPATALSSRRIDVLAQQVVARRLLALDQAHDLADHHDGPAVSLDAQQTERVAQRVTSRYRRRALWWQLAAASVMAMAVGSGAWAAVRIWLAPVTLDAVTASPAPTATTAARPRRLSARSAEPVAPNVETRIAQPITGPRVEEPSRDAGTTSVESLLERANAARAKRQWRQAERLYARAIELERNKDGGGSSDAAYTATVAAAALQLDQLDDADGALRRYQWALRARPHGTLSEEARYGVAQALRTLRRHAEEATALREFLRAHPSSLFAPQARARLASVSASE